MSNCSRSLESRSKADTTATRPSWSKAHSPIKSRPARSGAVTTSPVWPTNLSEGTCLGPCGFGSDQPGTPPFRFSQFFRYERLQTGNTIPESVIILERPGSDTTYVNAGAGTYYLSIGSANATWTVTVEECSASAPGSPNPKGSVSSSAPASKPASKPAPASPSRKPKPKRNLFDSGGPENGPVPLMPEGGCPAEFP